MFSAGVSEDAKRGGNAVDSDAPAVSRNSLAARALASSVQMVVSAPEEAGDEGWCDDTIDGTCTAEREMASHAMAYMADDEFSVSPDASNGEETVDGHDAGGS